tara:strand:- start:448 stop:588 length:141 start_codon:yes stop_codon:yes gene_type:complete
MEKVKMTEVRKEERVEKIIFTSQIFIKSCYKILVQFGIQNLRKRQN